MPNTDSGETQRPEIQSPKIGNHFSLTTVNLSRFFPMSRCILLMFGRIFEGKTTIYYTGKEVTFRSANTEMGKSCWQSVAVAQSKREKKIRLLRFKEQLLRKHLVKHLLSSDFLVPGKRSLVS